MLLQQYSSYVNPAAKIGRMVKNGDLVPIIKGLYETDRSIPGYYRIYRKKTPSGAI